MIIRKVSLDLLRQRPFELWNAFVDLIAKESHDELDEVQRVAQLAFWYDSEVQNGGHLQYFANKGATCLDTTLTALGTLGAECQRAVLQEAGRRFLADSREPMVTREQYVSAALTGEFDDLDSRYYACEPSIQCLLQGYLQTHTKHFIEIVDQ